MPNPHGQAIFKFGATKLPTPNSETVALRELLALRKLSNPQGKLRTPNSELRTLNSCIQIKSTKISHTVTIPHQICFRLDAQLLEQISQLQVQQAKLALSATNLANLRHYALLNLSPQQQSPFTQSCLSFATEYSWEKNQASASLFRSVINLEGKISQQIKQELSHNPSLLREISQAHYWLVAEILAQLPLTSKAWYSWLLASGFAIAMIIINLLIWYLPSLNYLLKLIICLSIFFLLTSVAKTLITQQLKSWIIYHLLQGILAKSTMRRKLGLNFLSFLLRT
jgi:hypothetical protein